MNRVITKLEILKFKSIYIQTQRSIRSKTRHAVKTVEGHSLTLEVVLPKTKHVTAVVRRIITPQSVAVNRSPQTSKTQLQRNKVDFLVGLRHLFALSNVMFLLTVIRLIITCILFQTILIAQKSRSQSVDIPFTH